MIDPLALAAYTVGIWAVFRGVTGLRSGDTRHELLNLAEVFVGAVAAIAAAIMLVK